jgi:AcrR family transcriptional regulator
MKNRGKQEEIMVAAAEVIAERGFHGSPMAMIANKAGVASGTLYVYFKSKEELIDALYRQMDATFQEELQRGYPSHKSIKERFIHIGLTSMNYFLSNPRQFRYLQQFHNSPYGAAQRREKMSRFDTPDIIRELFEEGVAQGVLKDLPLIVMLSMMFGSMVNVARDHVFGLIRLDELQMSQVLEACWDCIKK